MRSKCIGVLAIVLLVGFFADVAFAKITLTYNNYLPPVHVASKLSESWCKEIEKRTNGEVEFKYFPGGQLLPAPKVFEGVVQGIADIGFTNLADTHPDGIPKGRSQISISGKRPRV